MSFEELKEKGNQLFAKGDNAGASACYTEALSFCPEEDRNMRRILHSNRSAARLKAGDLDGALKDADQCLIFGPGWSKGLVRRGLALLALGKFQEANKAFEQALTGDPNNTSILENLEKAKKCMEDLEYASKVQGEYVKQDKVAIVEAKKEDVLASFFEEVAELQTIGEKKKTEVDHEKETIGWTPENQISRILQKHHKFLNLNPYFVFGFKTHSANEEDIKKRYHKLSSLVHPDKNQNPLARDCFEYLTKAHDELKDEIRRNYFLETFQVCRQTVEQKRAVALSSIYHGNEELLIQKEGTLEVAVDLEIKKVLGLAEQNRIKAEQLRAANEELLAKSEAAKEPNWAEIKKEQDLVKEGTEGRVKNWADFQKKKQKM